MAKLTNTITLITGATAGIGKACAYAFAEAGATLLLTGRRESRLADIAAHLRATYNCPCTTYMLDVRDRRAVEAFFESLPEPLRRIDILVNNAGMARGTDTMDAGNLDNWDDMIDTNIKGLLYVTRKALDGMAARKAGHIINIGSIAGMELYPGGNIYCATKFAVRAISKALRVDLLDKHIKVSSIDPGLVETEFSMVRFSGNEARAKAVYDGLQPLTPEDVADAVLWCATRPRHVNIGQVVMTPVNQATTYQVLRENK